MRNAREPAPPGENPATRSYQQELLEESLKCNIIIALDTGSGKTHIAVLRMKIEAEREPTKISWFLAPTVALCDQQRFVIQTSLPVSVGLISGSMEPDQWRNAGLWSKVLVTHRVMVTTPQVLLDALRHGYIKLGRDVSLLVFDEAHHAVDNHPYNKIMQEFYFELPPRTPMSISNIARPSVLGLTASPIYGGNVERAFKMIEANLDCLIRSVRQNRAELAQFVHRPIFKHVTYEPPSKSNPPFSTNLASLSYVIGTLSIDDDPYVHLLRKQLAKASPGTSEHHRLDQKLSKVIVNQDSFTHKGLRDLERTADVILNDLGSWAADWYVWEVIQQAKGAANPYNNIITTWKNAEKAYLLGILDKVAVTPVSYYADDIEDEASDKVRNLITVLLQEKFDAEDENEAYSGIIFVQRRDTVLALAEILRNHPFTTDVFRFGCLLGSSESSYRHSFLDITRTMLKDTQEETLADFRIGEKNVIISTSVAEEGIDIQACGSVIRWDPPPNMASWAQSRGRARRKRSTFTLMFDTSGEGREKVTKWEQLENEMVRLYNDPARLEMEEVEEAIDDPAENDVEFRVPSTGALLTLHSAVSHLSHFCAVIPSSAHADNRPLYDLDPPDMPVGWHSFLNRTQRPPPYQGPWGSKVTLPRALPLPDREFATEQVYKSKLSAHRHAAFMAYKALYDAQLLNENLLPITSIVEPRLEEEVRMMLRDVEKREGLASVALQMDPWVPVDGSESWWEYELTVEGLPSLRMFNRSKKISLPEDEGPVLYLPGGRQIQTWLRFVGTVDLMDDKLAKAREYTRMMFWSLNGSRMVWEDLDFSYLFSPLTSEGDAEWSMRRSWLTQHNAGRGVIKHEDEYLAHAGAFGTHFGYPTDITTVRNGFQFSKGYRFIRWRYEPLTEEEEIHFREYYKRFEDLEITYPLLVVEPLPARTNFLIPTPPPTTKPVAQTKTLNLLARTSAVVCLSAMDTEYSFLLPSILRSFAMTLTVSSLRDNLFASSPLSNIPNRLLTVAMSAPVSQEKQNYQRLETLGDTVLKFLVGLQLLAEYPLWHEGYLSKKKDHAVSNVRLAKENIKKGMYRWIIRDRMLGKKWKPTYFSTSAGPGERASPVTGNPQNVDVIMGAEPSNDIEMKNGEKEKSGDDDEKKEDQSQRDGRQRRKKQKQQELSTKVLADVMESTIGAAYLHGGFDLGYECTKFFDLGLKWQPLSSRIDTLLSRVKDPDDITIPPQLADVERMIGYTFKRKLLLIEALTHASYEQDLHTASYERMEFMGDSVLDMIVTDFLYHAPGKNYSPGHMHLRKSAVVNAHFLAYLCLRCNTEIDAAMPGRNENGDMVVQNKTQRIHLWQCLLHSSPRVLDDLTNTSARYRRSRPELEEALENDKIFPWAALTRLQAPKFFSDIIESIIGAVYLDSQGSIHIAQRVLRILGIMKVLEHIVSDDVDVLHPVSRLGLWASRHDRELDFEFGKERGNVFCSIVVDGKEEVRCEEIYRGQASQEEVKFMAAEKAIRMFKLRDGDDSWKALKGKRRPTKKKIKDKGKGKAL